MSIFFYSLGWGLLPRIILSSGRFSLTACWLTCVVLTIEPLTRGFFSASGHWLFSRTFVGALLLALTLSWAGRTFIETVRFLAWRSLRPHDPGRPSRRESMNNLVLLTGAVWGALVMAAMDGLSGAPQSAPFWPITLHNPLAGTIREHQLFRLAAAPWTLSLLFWGLKRMRR